MKKLLFVAMLGLFISGCASQSPACGSKAQKKAAYKSAKSGKAPGGNMLR